MGFDFKGDWIAVNRLNGFAETVEQEIEKKIKRTQPEGHQEKDGERRLRALVPGGERVLVVIIAAT